MESKTNELIYKTEKLINTEYKLMVSNEERKGKKGKMDAEDSEVQTTIFKMNKLQEYVV